MINIIKNSIKKEIKELNSILKNIKIKQEKILTINNIGKESLSNFELTTKNSYIYIIKSINKIDKDNIKKIKDYKDNYAMSRINNNFDSNNDNCLYVGSSHNIQKRLKEHLGIVEGSSKTYAMHLNKWWEYGPIMIEIYSIENDKHLQLYEDILWNYYKPLLGRQGKK